MYVYVAIKFVIVVEDRTPLPRQCSFPLVWRFEENTELASPATCTRPSRWLSVLLIYLSFFLFPRNQAIHEDEDENMEQGVELVTSILGEEKSHLYPSILQLVMADGVFAEGICAVLFSVVTAVEKHQKKSGIANRDDSSRVVPAHVSKEKMFLLQITIEDNTAIFKHEPSDYCSTKWNLGNCYSCWACVVEITSTSWTVAVLYWSLEFRMQSQHRPCTLFCADSTHIRDVFLWPYKLRMSFVREPLSTWSADKKRWLMLVTSCQELYQCPRSFQCFAQKLIFTLLILTLLKWGCTHV